MGATASGAGGRGQSVGLPVGRERELARILSALDTILAGAGRVVLLSGEPGVGKTRLAHEALAQAGERRTSRLHTQREQNPYRRTACN